MKEINKNGHTRDSEQNSFFFHKIAYSNYDAPLLPILGKL
jgi:hypothetical protein